MKLLQVTFMAIALFKCTTTNDKIPITTQSNEAKTMFLHAVEFEGLLKTDEAEKQYENAIKLDSTFALAHIRLAMLKDDFAKRRLHIKQAMQHLDKLSEGEKLWILARNNFYGTQDGKSEYDCFKTVVKLFPKDENANYMFGFVNLHHGVNQPDSAIHYYKKALKINPKVSRHYNELAYAYMAKQDFKNAEKVIQDYIAFLPNHVNPRDTYAELLMRDHRYKESIEAYKSVLKINPNAPWAYMGMSANLSFLHRFKEARNFLKPLDTLELSDYEYRHKWRSKVCGYLIEQKIDSAIVVLNQQNSESLSGENKREPIFHQFITHSRITRLYFENNQPDEGVQSFMAWKNFVKTNITRQETIDNVLGLEEYFMAFAHILKGNDEAAKIIIENNKNPSDDMKLLRARLFLKEKNHDKAIGLLNTLDANNPYYLHWLSKAYGLKNDDQNFKSVSNKIKDLIEMNNINYALIISEHSELL
ncbi:tetratricopeptide repeat protein [Hwangdonia seohaensis]|uniref:Tetratricopeptide repeat protein n=1 Tax=Hwangdonia seohaensis TaxID=1240727 RepID=A0ABW3RDJ3_9FLAO|nr:tetratricopeptide repeat protein [Hwangdonia seohaensis]